MPVPEMPPAAVEVMVEFEFPLLIVELESKAPAVPFEGPIPSLAPVRLMIVKSAVYTVVGGFVLFEVNRI